jgi:hypothetical protein
MKLQQARLTSLGTIISGHQPLSTFSNKGIMVTAAAGGSESMRRI